MNTIKDAIYTKDLAVTAAVYLRPETDAGSHCHQAELLRDDVDAILSTDNQFGELHMSTIAAASTLLDTGMATGDPNTFPEVIRMANLA